MLTLADSCYMLSFIYSLWLAHSSSGLLAAVKTEVSYVQGGTSSVCHLNRRRFLFPSAPAWRLELKCPASVLSVAGPCFTSPLISTEEAVRSDTVGMASTVPQHTDWD